MVLGGDNQSLGVDSAEDLKRLISFDPLLTYYTFMLRIIIGQKVTFGRMLLNESFKIRAI